MVFCLTWKPSAQQASSSIKTVKSKYLLCGKKHVPSSPLLYPHEIWAPSQVWPDITQKQC